jgi:hypothetical protein
MRKVLFATTALATAAGALAVANADVSISGSQEWRYLSISDDYSSRASTTDFTADTDVTISFSTTTDSGLTMGMTSNISETQGRTTTSSISGDFGTVTVSEGWSAIHAASSYDVTSVGIAGGHGDPGYALVDSSGSSVSGVEIDEAQIDDDSSGAVIVYDSPSFGGFSFGVGASHLASSDDNTSMSMGAKYSGSMGDVSYTIGYASYDGVGANTKGNHIGANISWDAVTFGIGSASNETSASSKKETLSYSVNYAVSDDLTLNIGRSTSENKMGTAADLEAANTTIGVAYSVAPGLTAALSSHSVEYKSGGSVNNDGQVVQAEIKMSF